jgi:hypothetical protein
MNVIGRLKRFVHKHDRLLSVFGALIIFLTFLAREKFRDELKELVDSVDAAESVFMIRSDNHDVAEQIEYVHQYLTSKRQTWEGLRSPDGYYRELTAELDASLHLLAKVPHGEELNKEGRDLLARREKWHMDILYPIAPLPSDPPTAQEKAAIAAQDAAEKKLWEDAKVLDNQARDFGRRVVDLARKVEAEDEYRYRMSKSIIVILFILGWSLTFVGKIFGVEGLNVSG